MMDQSIITAQSNSRMSKNPLCLIMCLCCLVGELLFTGCSERKTSLRKVEANWNLIHAGMTRKEVEDLLGRPPQVFNQGEALVFWYPSGLSEKERNQAELQVTAYVVTITNGVVKTTYVPQH